MPFVHVLTSGQVASPAFYPTETLANAAVAADGGSVLNLTTVPDAAEPGAWYNATAQTFSLVPPAENDTGRLRTAVRNAHNQLFVWKRAVDKEGEVHSALHVGIAHNYLAFAHQGIYLMAHNHRLAGNTDWTVAQRITTAQRMGQGAADITSAFEFFQRVEIDAFPNPTSAVLWVNVNTGARVNLGQATSMTATMALDLAQLPSESILHGAWIDSLEA